MIVGLLWHGKAKEVDFRWGTRPTVTKGFSSYPQSPPNSWATASIASNAPNRIRCDKRQNLMNEAGEMKTAEELAAVVGGRVSGDAHVGIEYVASVESANAGSVAFVEDVKGLESARDCEASALIVPDGAGQRAREIAE